MNEQLVTVQPLRVYYLFIIDIVHEVHSVDSLHCLVLLVASLLVTTVPLSLTFKLTVFQCFMSTSSLTYLASFVNSNCGNEKDAVWERLCFKLGKLAN